MSAALDEFVVAFDAADHDARLELPTDEDYRRFGSLVDRIDADLLAPERVAESTIDEIKRDRRRPQAERQPLTARECLAALSYEALIVCISADNLAAGLTLSDDDRLRLRIASVRIDTIVGEVVR